MRHRRRGRVLGRSPKHQRALLRNLASALLLTERDAEFDSNAPKIKGRIVTTVSKAKEVRPLVERCVTLARRTLADQRRADDLATDAERQSDAWRTWRNGDGWREWNQAIAPVLAARRRAIQLLGDKEAVRILFDTIAPRFEDRPGGYTRILQLAKPRLGDAGPRAILEFVGVRDRDAGQHAEAPSFDDAVEDDVEEIAEKEAAADETGSDGSEEAVADEHAETDDENKTS